MPTTRITMRQIRETLRLHLQANLTYSEVARTLKLSKSVVGKYLSLARAAGVDWAAAQLLDAKSNSMAFPQKLTRRVKRQWAYFSRFTLMNQQFMMILSD